MASFKLEKAEVLRVGTTENVTESFRKRELILKTDTESQYPQIIKIEAVQAKCDDQQLNEVRPGDIVSVDFNLNGRESTGKDGKLIVFNTLQLWKLSITQTSAASQPQYSVPQINPEDEENDGLPF